MYQSQSSLPEEKTPITKDQHASICKNEIFGLLRSLNLKHCDECYNIIHWPLDKGQKKVL
jgi:hypothetical protein